jgi:hemerythrin-like metal-binding protein
MALIQWTGKYQTGIEEIDAQHKLLVGYINELNDAIQADSGQEALGGTLSKLTDYAEFHFAFEEGLLEELGYAELAAHRERHQEFIELIEGMGEHLENGKTNMGDMLMVFLRNWLSKHILIDDMYALSAPNRSLG